VIWTTYVFLVDVVGGACGALSCRMRALWKFLFNYQGHVGEWAGLMVIWSSGLGLHGFSSETSLPDL